MDFKRLYKELVRRNVFRAVLAYLAVAWVLIEVSSTILPTFGAPEYLIKGLIYLLGIGLVIWTGFSWVYDLTPQGIRKTPEDHNTSETRALNSRRLNAVIVGSGLTAVLVLLAGSFWAGSHWNSTNALSGETEYRIAVLPFEDRSDNAEFEYLKEGLAEDVISELFGFSGVSVISSRSSFQFGDSDKPIEQISRELNADLVLIGNYDISNQNVNVKVEVIDTRDNEILNYASIVGDLGHIRDISAEISHHLQQSLGLRNEQEEKGSSDHQDVDLEAFKLNALGKSAMRDHTGQKLEVITQYFKAAIALDPEYFDPYIGMAQAYVFEVNRGYLSPAEAALKVKEYALKAEKLRPGSGEVSCMMGIIHSFDYDFRNAFPYFEQALEKSPNFTLTYEWYSFALLVSGDLERAVELHQKALLLDPLNTIYEMTLAMIYMYQHQYANAEALIDSKLAMEPDHMQMIWMKAVLQAQMGLYEEAYATILKRQKYLETNFMAGYIFGKVGDLDRAEAVLDKILTRSRKRYVPPSQIAILLCGLGKYDQALDQVERAYLLHDQWFLWVVYPSFCEPIKNDPRYTSIMAELGWIKTSRRH
jgi:TolB-like protein/Tfp pilus assembly protein PilF